MRELPGVQFHSDPALFKEAISYTSAQTRFIPRLVEKDYFCTVILERLSFHAGANVGRVAGLNVGQSGVLDGRPGLVFKGGTCLTKAYLGFYRKAKSLQCPSFAFPQATPRSRGSSARVGFSRSSALPF
jgi:hypothetical protein